MNDLQSCGAILMALGCALPTCFFPEIKYINLLGSSMFAVGGIIFIAGSDENAISEVVE